MLPRVEHLPQHDDASFNCRAYACRAFVFAWHVHPEYELTFITSGRGQRYVGDHMDLFTAGDLVLLGGNLPHTWHSQPAVGRRSAAVVVQFRHDFLGPGFFDRPEWGGVRRLLAQSRVGLAFHGRTARRVGAELVQMPARPPVARITSLLGLLEDLARCRQARRLATQPFDSPLRDTDRRRIDRACRYVTARLDQPLRQADAAAHVNLSASAFARFFRRNTGQTFVTYVHRLRVAHACRLLIETDQPITRIAYAVGFGNLSHFNRVFLRLKRVTPRAFRARYTA